MLFSIDATTNKLKLFNTYRLLVGQCGSLNIFFLSEVGLKMKVL